MTNLKQLFANHKVFIPFVVANDPDAATTVANVLALAENGADIVELGIPFSDPIADGPVIQNADLRAFADGVTPAKIFDLVGEIRQKSDVPLIFLTYLNIIFKYGYDAFCKRCSDLNISGLVIPDMPFEEKNELAPYAARYDIDLIPLITPTSGPRIAKIASAATGFIYVVSSLGITGQRNSFDTGLKDLLTTIRQHTDVPTAIGFGIHTPAQAQAMTQIADGVIIGSAIVDIVGKSGHNAPAEVGAYAKSIRQAMDQPVDAKV